MPLHNCLKQVSGQKFYYLRNAAALLELALVNWAMTKVRKGQSGSLDLIET